MTINEHLAVFAGRTVEEFDYDRGFPDPKNEAYRLSLSYDEYDEGLYWEDKLDRFLAHPDSSKAEALVIGPWEEVGSQDSEFIVELLNNNHDKLPNLKALFFGDIVMEESECSWIEHGDMSPLLQAFPKLTHFAVRGCGSLSLGTALKHDRLRSLVIQCGGLSKSVLNEVINANLPELEHLELWLGEDNYGADFDLEDLRPLVNKNPFPKLRALGLKNSMIQDDIATLVANSPIVNQLKVLDLSLGTLSDEGAKALLVSPGVRKLELLDIYHHYVSQKMVDQLKALGIKVNADGKQPEEKHDGEIWRYISVGE